MKLMTTVGILLAICFSSRTSFARPRLVGATGEITQLAYPVESWDAGANSYHEQRIADQDEYDADEDQLSYDRMRGGVRDETNVEQDFDDLDRPDEDQEFDDFGGSDEEQDVDDLDAPDEDQNEDDLEGDDDGEADADIFTDAELDYLQRQLASRIHFVRGPMGPVITIGAPGMPDEKEGKGGPTENKGGAPGGGFGK